MAKWSPPFIITGVLLICIIIILLLILANIRNHGSGGEVRGSRVQDDIPTSKEGLQEGVANLNSSKSNAF